MTSEPAPLSLLSLPKELVLKCLINFDWRTLANAQCASRELRALVSYITRQPYWVTHVEEQPAILITQFESPASLEEACSHWVDSLLSQTLAKGPPDLCLFFASPRWSPNLDALLGGLRARLPGCCSVAGMVAHGVLGRDSRTGKVEELDGLEEPCLSVSLIRFPLGTRVHVSRSNRGAVTGDLPPAGESNRHRTWVVMGAEPMQDVDTQLRWLATRYPGSTFLGGLAGGSEPGPALIGGLPLQGPRQPVAQLTWGTLCISIDSPHVGWTVVPTRGAKRFSTCYTVTSVDHDVELVGNPGMSLVRELSNVMNVRSSLVPRRWLPVGPPFSPTSALVSALHQLQPGEVNPRLPLFVGVQRPDTVLVGELTPADFLILLLHDPTNIMRQSGNMPLAYPVEPGSLAAFFLADPQLSRQQLRQRMEAAARELLTGERAGAESDMLPLASVTGASMATGSPLLESEASDAEEEGSREYGQASAAAAAGLEARAGEASTGSLLNLPGELAEHAQQAQQPAEQPQQWSLQQTKRQAEPLPVELQLLMPPQPVVAGLMFPCGGRGHRFYGERGVESEIVASVFPGAPLCGCFCNGELGAVPGDEGDHPDGVPAHVLGFTTIVGLVRMLPCEGQQ